MEAMGEDVKNTCSRCAGRSRCAGLLAAEPAAELLALLYSHRPSKHKPRSVRISERWEPSIRYVVQLCQWNPRLHLFSCLHFQGARMGRAQPTFVWDIVKLLQQ